MEVRLPRLGEGADSGSVAAIFVKEGDRVKKDQSLIELESEKAVASIPSPAAGTVKKIHVKEGDEIKVGQAIMTLSEDGASGSAKVREDQRAPVKKEEVGIVVEDEGPRQVDERDGQPRSSSFPPPASPSIRKMAKQLGIDLNRVRGSERGGRIVLDDIRRYVGRLQLLAKQPSGAPPAPLGRPVPEQIDFSKWGPVKKQKMSQLRRAISRKMTESWTTIPHVTQFADADITDLMALRKRYAPLYEKKHAHLTLTGFVIKAVVAALKKYPMFNSSLDETTDEIIRKNYYHIGIAVDTGQGLIVPVIRDADRKSLFEISRELHDLAERTRKRKVSLEEMHGGTFTVSNQGGIGGAHFTPIINKPEVAILGVGQGKWHVAVDSKNAEKRLLLPLGLSYDHRVIDGADAARFVTEFVAALERFSESDIAMKSGSKKGKK